MIGSESESESEPVPMIEPESEPGLARGVGAAIAPVTEPESAKGTAPGSDADETRVVLLSRDPEWVFCYWDITPAARAVARGVDGRLTLRLHDVTDIDFDGSNGWSQHLYPLTEEARWWHVPVPHRGRRYLAEVGYCTAEGTFRCLGRSESVATLYEQQASGDKVELATHHIDAPLAARAPLAPASGAEGEHSAGGGIAPGEGGGSGTAGRVHRPAAGPHEQPPAWGAGGGLGSAGGRSAPSSSSLGEPRADRPASSTLSHAGSSAVWSRWG